MYLFQITYLNSQFIGLRNARTTRRVSRSTNSRPLHLFCQIIWINLFIAIDYSECSFNVFGYLFANAPMLKGVFAICLVPLRKYRQVCGLELDTYRKRSCKQFNFSRFLQSVHVGFGTMFRIDCQFHVVPKTSSDCNTS